MSKAFMISDFSPSLEAGGRRDAHSRSLDATSKLSFSFLFQMMSDVFLSFVLHYLPAACQREKVFSSFVTSDRFCELKDKSYGNCDRYRSSCTISRVGRAYSLQGNYSIHISSRGVRRELMYSVLLFAERFCIIIDELRTGEEPACEPGIVEWCYHT
jgi:hypothetical protein